MAEEREYEWKTAFESVGMYKEWWANPAIVALMGFALTTMATGLHNAGYWGAGAPLALAIAFGGTAQFIGGVVDLRKGSLFGGSAFMSYGAFWWGFFFLGFVLPRAGIEVGAMDVFAFLAVWTLFTFAFLIASPKVGNYICVLFILLFIAFLLLDGLVLGLVPPAVAGWETFFTGLLAWYIAMAELVNSMYGRKILPIS